MPSCITLDELVKGCDFKGQSGIKKLYIGLFNDVSAIAPELNAVGTPEDAGIITSVTMSGTPATKFYAFEYKDWTAQFKQSGKGTEGATNPYYEFTFSCEVNKPEAAKRNLLRLMSQEKLVLIYEDMNNIFWFVGEEFGLDLTQNDMDSGKAMGEASYGYVLAFTGKGTEMIREIEETVVTGLI